ncbi:hypothetical protein [Lysobacter gummosus]|uniref:hypothetical protein n=1 Tax=Lysobacter gummosus TaxID=262324 RepID=UPI00362E0878
MKPGMAPRLPLNNRPPAPGIGGCARRPRPPVPRRNAARTARQGICTRIKIAWDRNGPIRMAPSRSPARPLSDTRKDYPARCRLPPLCAPRISKGQQRNPQFGRETKSWNIYALKPSLGLDATREDFARSRGPAQPPPPAPPA